MKHRRWQWVILPLLLCLLAGAALPQAEAQAQQGERCFAETGSCISGRIREFWEQHGGLAVFGLPITPLQTQTIEGQPVQVQWFERNRLELHPENAPPFDVLLGRLGEEVLTAQERSWYTFPKSDPQEGCRFFEETGHNVCGPILAAWQASGLEIDGRAGKSELESLALFGLPLSDARLEQLSDGRQYLVQWFERVRFELHPENQPPHTVLLDLLGNELQGRAATARPASVSRFEPGACPFGVPGDLRIECGTLVVPENRSQPDSGEVRLAVAVVRSHSANPAPDPVLYLSGGPGSPALGSTVAFARGWSYFLQNRDFVVFDQRGTGRSLPSLHCPEINDVGERVINENLSRAAKVLAEAEALTRCGERLRAQGVDLTAYHSAASAADMHDLRVALGYEQWNIFGISYGTRLALTALRDYPGDVRSVILDSVYPPQVNLYTAMPATIDRSFRTIFNNCAATPACNASYPDLERVFYELVEQLNTQPASVQVRHPRSGATVTTDVDGNDLIDNLFRATYRTNELAGLPGMIYATRNGNYAALARLESDRLGRMFGGSFSQGSYFAVQCNEEIPFDSLQELQAVAASYPRLEQFFAGVMEFTDHVYALCDSFGIDTPRPIENEPVQSDIPALLLAGEYDPITPPFWAPLAAETLSTSYVYQFSGTGHAVITRGACPQRLIRGFLDNPTSPPDGSCVR